MAMGDFPLKKAILFLGGNCCLPLAQPQYPQNSRPGPLIKRYPQSLPQETRPVITCPQNNSSIETTDWAPPTCCFVYVTPNSLLGSCFRWVNWSHLLQKCQACPDFATQHLLREVGRAGDPPLGLSCWEVGRGVLGPLGLLSNWTGTGISPSASP